MADLSQQTSADEPRVAYQTARTTAKVAGTFAIVFLALFVSNFIGTSVIAPLRENRLVEMKAELRGGDPTEEQLADIRQLDLQIRRNRMWRLDFAHKSGYALLVSVVLFLVAANGAGLNEPPPRPKHRMSALNRFVRPGAAGRWSPDW